MANIPNKEPMKNSANGFIATRMVDIKYSPFTPSLNPDVLGVTPASVYPIVTKLNTVRANDFGTKTNLMGNIVPRLVTSNNSRLNACFDTMSLKLKLRYMYLTADATDNLIVGNRLFNDTCIEALANAQAEMMTQLPFFQLAYANGGDTNAPKISQTDKMDPRVSFLFFYQTYVLNVFSVLSKYHQLIQLENILVTKGFQRESSVTTELFGLLNKTAFKAKLSTISQFLSNCYTDRKVLEENAPVANMASSRTSGLLDPLISVKSSYAMPQFKLAATATTTSNAIFDTDSYKVTITKYSGTGTSTTTELVAFSDLVERLIDKLDQQSVLAYARSYYMGTVRTTPTMYFNEINWLIDGLSALNNKFTRDTTEIHTALKVTNQINLWKQGSYIDVRSPIVRLDSVDYNVTLQALLSSYLAAPSKIEWDAKIQGWTFSTIWNENTNIPLYDQYVKGSYLTFSTREVDFGNLPVEDVARLVPVLFKVETNSVVATNRVGYTIIVNYEDMNGSTFFDDPIFGRLMAFDSQKTVNVRVPKVDLTSSGSSLNLFSSTANMLIQKMFGFGKIQLSARNTNSSISPDDVVIIDGQIADISGDLVAYYKGRAPFKVWNAN